MKEPLGNSSKPYMICMGFEGNISFGVKQEKRIREQNIRFSGSEKRTEDDNRALG